MNTLDHLETPAKGVSWSADAHTISRLEAILSRWMKTGAMPDEVGVLSSGEYIALMLAAGREDLLGRSPVADFLILDCWLQKWVMQARGWTSFIGTRLGD